MLLMLHHCCCQEVNSQAGGNTGLLCLEENPAFNDVDPDTYELMNVHVQDRDEFLAI